MHPLYERALPWLQRFPSGSLAVDLGCGAGQGAVFLAEHGFRVLAVDSQSEPLEHLRRNLVRELPIETVQADAAAFDLPPCQVVAATFLLFLLDQGGFDRLWDRIEEALSPGGILLCQFLGPHDSWASEGALTHSDEEIESLLQPYETLYREDLDRPGKTVWGEAKHWHIHHLILQRRA